jgi:hypothetical protein
VEDVCIPSTCSADRGPECENGEAYSLSRPCAGRAKPSPRSLLAGRDFDERDKPGSKHVVIVNQAFARQLLPNEDPLGKRFRHSVTETDWNEIVGVVEDGK